MVAPKVAIPLADLQKKQKEIVNKVGYKSGIGEYDDPAVKEYHPAYKYDPLLNPPPEVAPIQERLVREVKKVIASIPGAVLIGKPTGVKTFKSASGKLEREYDGEDWGRFKDLNRCTVVVLKSEDMKTAYGVVKTYFSGRELRSGFLFHQEKIVEAHLDPCGYSGYTVFVRSIGGEKAEIQINYPPIMYAKSVEEFRLTMADREAKMKADYPVLPGGLGHKLYDLHKLYKGTGFKKALEDTSKLYYYYFRSERDLALGAAGPCGRAQSQQGGRTLSHPAKHSRTHNHSTSAGCARWCARWTTSDGSSFLDGRVRRVWTQRRS